MTSTTRDAFRKASASAVLTSRDGNHPGSRRAARRDRSTRLGADFETFATSLRLAIMPASALEIILADRMILAAWRLKLASAIEFDTVLAGDSLDPFSRETLHAESSLEKALELLETTRANRLGRDYRPASRPSNLPGSDFDADSEARFRPDALGEADFSNEWTTLPDGATDRDEPAVRDEIDNLDDDDEISPRWQDRLVFDFNVSEVSPVVKGTWVTASHVVSLIVDGWTWSDILRSHPELTEDDIRTCLAYTVELDSSGGI